MDRNLFVVLAWLLMSAFFTSTIKGETFKDDEYKYKIDLPDGALPHHKPHASLNLVFTLPDSTATFAVYALDVGELPQDELASSDSKLVYREDYIARLDKEILNINAEPDTILKDPWVDKVIKKYKFGEDNEAITYTFFHKEYPHVVLVVGQDLERPEIKETLESFRTPKFVYTWKSILVWIAICGVAMLIGFLGGGGVKNEALGSFLFYVFFLGGFIVFVFLCINSFTSITKYIWYYWL